MTSDIANEKKVKEKRTEAEGGRQETADALAPRLFGRVAVYTVAA